MPCHASDAEHALLSGGRLHAAVRAAQDVESHGLGCVQVTQFEDCIVFANQGNQAFNSRNQDKHSTGGSTAQFQAQYHTCHETQHRHGLNQRHRYCLNNANIEPHLDRPLCSMEGVAMTTQGPMSSRWREDFRCVTCLNMKGLEEACMAHTDARHTFVIARQCQSVSSCTHNYKPHSTAQCTGCPLHAHSAVSQSCKVCTWWTGAHMG